MDLGSGNEFWTTWRGKREELNDSIFKAELNEVVNQLRKDGLLKDRYSMHKMCANKSNLALGGSHGFSVESEKHFFSFDVCPCPAITMRISMMNVTKRNSRSRRISPWNSSKNGRN
ncbi:MAG: hypothetical protein J1F03_10730 [Oscillospiraceae bacterium]|nr:hypothetical protein [Oscillospiraceae bacterium]